MIFKITFALILVHIVVIEGISFCCPEPNILGAKGNCSDGTRKKELNCEDSFILRTNDKSLNFSFDDKENLILEWNEIVPPNEYCKTLLRSKNAEVLIICAADVDDDIDNISRTICTVFELISVFFILLTIIVYLIIPDALYLQDICIIHSISGLAVSYITLAIINLSGHLEDEPCHFLAHLLYFSFMYCFFWLNVLCFHIWREVTQPRFLANVHSWKIIYHVYAIGAPILAVAWLLIQNYGRPASLAHIYPGIGLSKCWFKTVREANIYFNVPIAILIVINLIYFIWTMVGLWRCTKVCPKIKILKYRSRMYLKLFLVMGITWIFEIVSTVFEDDAPKWLWILTDIFNALQGLIIFLVLVVFRKTIKRSLANRKIFNWRLPAQWKNEKDSECEELEEDINLGTSAVPSKQNIYN